MSDQQDSELFKLIKNMLTPDYTIACSRQEILQQNCVEIPENIQIHIILLLNHHKELFTDIQNTLDKIVSDHKINAKDTPEIMFIVGKMYEVIYNSTFITNKSDYYDIIKHLLYVSAVLYLRVKNKCSPEILENLLSILQSSIELIKLKSSIKPSKFKFKLF